MSFKQIYTSEETLHFFYFQITISKMHEKEKPRRFEENSPNQNRHEPSARERLGRYGQPLQFENEKVLYSI